MGLTMHRPGGDIDRPPTTQRKTGPIARVHADADLAPPAIRNRTPFSVTVTMVAMSEKGSRPRRG